MTGQSPVPIPNSKYWRTWCIHCGTPMRASLYLAQMGAICEGCNPNHTKPKRGPHHGLTYRQHIKLRDMEEE
jgi:hypothetical protein